MTAEDRRARIRALAAAADESGTPTAWFEPFYQEAGGNPAEIPWGDLAPNRLLTDWLDTPDAPRPPGHALVVGCGLGDDAAMLAERGWRVTAFDIAPSAVQWARGRFPGAPIDWEVADALAVPAKWHGQFDLIVEIYTLQTLPAELRGTLLGQLAACLVPGGTLVVICRGRDEHEEPSQLPWKLTWRELDAPIAGQVEIVRHDDLLDHDTPPQRRFRAVYRSKR